MDVCDKLRKLVYVLVGGKEYMFCHICGKQITEGMAYCESCGNRDFARKQNNYAYCPEIRNLLGDNSEYEWIWEEIHPDALEQNHPTSRGESAKEAQKKKSEEINQSIDIRTSVLDVVKNQETESTVSECFNRKNIVFLLFFVATIILIAGSLGFSVAYLLHREETEDFIAEEMEVSESTVDVDLKTDIPTEVDTNKITVKTTTQTRRNTETMPTLVEVDKLLNDIKDKPEFIDDAPLLENALNQVFSFGSIDKKEDKFTQIEMGDSREFKIQTNNCCISFSAKPVGKMKKFNYEEGQNQRMQLDESIIEMTYSRNEKTVGYQYDMEKSEKDGHVGIAYMESVSGVDDTYFMILYFYNDNKYKFYLLSKEKIYLAKNIERMESEKNQTDEDNEETESASELETEFGHNGKL